MNRRTPRLAIVVPCFNEQATLPSSLNELRRALSDLTTREAVALDSFLLFVDDGSEDDTWKLIEEAHDAHPTVRGLRLAGNVGHQSALLAGMLTARPDVDCIISIDADLQDDVGVMPTMIERFADGFDIVYGVRGDRSSDHPVKRWTAGCFYALARLLGARLVPQHADYRLVGRPALDALQEFGERNVFLRGLFPSMGFRWTTVSYARLKRTTGESKYTTRRMVALAVRGILVMSPAPLRLSAFLGLVTLVFAVALSAFALVAHARGSTIPGWTSLIIIVLVMGSTQLFCLAVIGEYLAKVFDEVKRRPRYIVERLL